MLKMTFVENNPLTDLELRLIRFVNSNIVDIINSIMDMISDGFDMAYYFPREYYRKNKKNCNEFIYDLRNTRLMLRDWQFIFCYTRNKT